MCWRHLHTFPKYLQISRRSLRMCWRHPRTFRKHLKIFPTHLHTSARQLLIDCHPFGTLFGAPRERGARCVEVEVFVRGKVFARGKVFVQGEAVSGGGVALKQREC